MPNPLQIDQYRVGTKFYYLTMADDYTPGKPFVVPVPRYVAGHGTPEIPYTKMELPEEFPAEFRLPRGLKFEPATMTDLFLPDKLLDTFVSCSNAYAKKNLSKRRYVPIKRKDVLYFFGVYQYMGLVRLPAKDDYFSTEGNWPLHPLLSGLSKTWFQYMFRNIHMTETELLDVEEPTFADLEEMGESDNEDDGGDVNDCNVEKKPVIDSRWYAKVGPLIDHFNEVCKRICVHPSYTCAIDEMMKRFKGRSGQTARMKGKPVKEGYKFFSVCCSETGFIYHLIPDGRLEKSTISKYVFDLTDTLPLRDELNYVVAMDNYFTFPSVIIGMRARNVAVVGTARARRGWPPKEMRNITDGRFNTLYTMNDDFNFKILRWVDNNIVTMVSTLHDGEESIERRRKRPRLTATNRRNVQQVWGNQGVTQIEIPCVIDDYNHWMGGVDKADQLIAYYRPDLRCRRVWVPIMFHVLDCIRANAYIACHAKGYKGSHKDFTMDWIKALLARAKAEDVRDTRQCSGAVDGATTPSPTMKRRRMSHTKPELPSYRFNGPKEDHHMVRMDGKGQPKACTYCSFLAALAKGAGGVPPKIAPSRLYCFSCGDFLCKEHEESFHSKEMDESDGEISV